MMQANTLDPASATSGLLGWLGFGRSQPGAAKRQPRNLTTQGRTALIERIGAFLIEHDLEVTPANLAIAHAVASGLDPLLERKIDRRGAAGQPISQEWLEDATAPAEPNDRALDLLAGRLERELADFARSTQNARSATQCYGNALESHMGSLVARENTGKVISDLAALAGVMLERTRKAEACLQESEEEAAALRRNLESARRDADCDCLTGLPNRRAFEARMAEEFATAKAAGDQLCVAFCDIDHFKQVNDTHGHEAGDRIICIVGKTLAALSGDRCHVARHGGEEFVLLLRGLPLEDARDLLDGQRRTLAERRLVNLRTERPFGRITFSAGIADVFAYRTCADALAAADEALYQAKQGGRNRVQSAKIEQRGE